MFARFGRFSRPLLLTMVLLPVAASAPAQDLVESLAQQLQQGQLDAAEASLRERLTAQPEDNQAQFALGVVRVLTAIEHLAQDQYRFGALGGTIQRLPVLRIPVPQNPQPEAIDYARLRTIFLDFQTRLLQAEGELAKVDASSSVALPLDLATIRLDLNGDGQAEPRESFLPLLEIVNRQRPGNRAATVVRFDGGDVLWLRGYCHLLAGFCDLVLAYDHQQLFDHAGQLIYPKHVQSEEVAEPLDLPGEYPFELQIVDLIAAIHLMKFSLREPERMESARRHWLEMVRLSRESWKLILAEDDNDQEWLPNPKQTGVLGIPVSVEMIDSWQRVLSEMEDLLEGRKLVPFWRDYRRILAQYPAVPAIGRGFNLKRFFAEPRDFDLVLLIQGTAALPYIEHGELSRPETWQSLTQAFRGQFFGFAIWFN